MDIEEALRWVDRNCTDAATLDRLRSRMVAKTLADEVERLRNLQEKQTDAAITEREACAELCEQWNATPGERLAAAIRARSKAGNNAPLKPADAEDMKIYQSIAANYNAGPRSA